MASSSFAFGVSAAAAAPFVMTVGFIFWDNNWRGSSFSLNLFKCNLAALAFLIVSAANRGSNPFSASVFTVKNIGFLMLSSTIGIIIGDYLWLEGLRLLGARRVIVVDAVKPFLSALFGWAILGEKVRYPAFGGLALTVVGVLVVSLERTESVAASVDAQSGSEGRVDSATVLAVSTDASPISSEANGQLPVTDPVIYEQTMPSPVDPQTPRSDEPEIELQERGGSCVVAMPEHSKGQGSLRENRTHTAVSLRRGYFSAVLNVVFDTYGSVLTKQFGGDMTTWEISLVRFGFAGAVLFLVSVACAFISPWLQVPGNSSSAARRSSGQEAAGEDNSNYEDQSSSARDKDSPPWYLLPSTMSRLSWLKVVTGVVLVTFLTPALSNYALFEIALALALTLGSVGPLYALPLSWLLQNDKPSLRCCLGASMAVAGVIVLIIFGRPG